MNVRHALRDAALVVPAIFVLVLAAAYALKNWPHAVVWLIAGGVIIVRFLLVALRVSGRGQTRPT